MTGLHCLIYCTRTTYTWYYRVILYVTACLYSTFSPFFHSILVLLSHEHHRIGFFSVSTLPVFAYLFFQNSHWSPFTSHLYLCFAHYPAGISLPTPHPALLSPYFYLFSSHVSLFFLCLTVLPGVSYTIFLIILQIYWPLLAQYPIYYICFLVGDVFSVGLLLMDGLLYLSSRGGLIW